MRKPLIDLLLLFNFGCLACINFSRLFPSLKNIAIFVITEYLVNLNALICLLELTTCEIRRTFKKNGEPICHS